jgi:uncharacterized membrane protein
MAMRSEAITVGPWTPTPTTKDPDAWPFTHWPTVVIVHTAAAFAVLGLGTFVLFAPKGTPTHRLLGRVWVTAMVATSLTSFGIKGLTGGHHISFIHGLSIYVLLAVTLGIYFIRTNNVKYHKWCMKSCYYAALIAGFFTVVIPGRRFYNLIFGVPKQE